MKLPTPKYVYFYCLGFTAGAISLLEFLWKNRRQMWKNRK